MQESEERQADRQRKGEKEQVMSTASGRKASKSREKENAITSMDERKNTWGK